MLLDETPGDVIRVLQDKYPTKESRVNLKLDESLVKQILEIVESIGFEIQPTANFPTQNFSSTALELFESTLRQQLQLDNYNTFIPTEQILRDLIINGWIILPPKGM